MKDDEKIPPSLPTGPSQQACGEHPRAWQLQGSAESTPRGGESRRKMHRPQRESEQHDFPCR